MGFSGSPTGLDTFSCGVAASRFRTGLGGEGASDFTGFRALVDAQLVNPAKRRRKNPISRYRNIFILI